jgi:hypothetical protein
MSTEESCIIVCVALFKVELNFSELVRASFGSV